MFKTLIFSALGYYALNTFGASQGGKWKLYVIDGAAKCEGWHNGSSCQQVCIYIEGVDTHGKYSKKQACTEAHGIDTYEKLTTLKKRVFQVEAEMNRPGFKGWSLDQLKDGFYPFAQKIDPEKNGPTLSDDPATSI